MNTYVVSDLIYTINPRPLKRGSMHHRSLEIFDRKSLTYSYPSCCASLKLQYVVSYNNIKTFCGGLLLLTKTSPMAASMMTIHIYGFLITALYT